MFSKNFEKWDSILGWMVFFIALIVYALTVEPTGSCWDAGEYITTSAKLQVGHPPGAPLLQILGAFFAMFALDADQVAQNGKLRCLGFLVLLPSSSCFGRSPISPENLYLD